MPSSTCPGCGLTLPARPGPTHRYVVTSPECWALFGRTTVDNRERLLTDAYMAQHPDGHSPQQRQSVAVHLVTLNAVLQIGQPLETASRITQAGVDVGRALGGYRTLNRPTEWRSTIADVAEGTTGMGRYINQVLDAWLETEQAVIDEWTDRALGYLYS